MNESRKFLQNTLIYSIGTFGSKALIFLLVPIFSYYLSKSELGIYDIVMSVVTLCVPFLTLQVSNSTYRFLLETEDKDVETRKLYFTNSILISIFGILTFCIVLSIVSSFLESEYYLYLLFLTIVSAFLPVLQNYLRGVGKTKFYATVGILNAFLIFAFNISFLMFLDLKIKGLFIATILANFITILFILLYGEGLKYLSIKKFNINIVKKLLIFSIPLIPNTVSWWLINSADKFLILYILTAEMNGIYAISSRFPSIVTIINSVFILAWQDHILISKSNNEKSGTDKLATSLFDNFINFEFSLVLVLISTSEIKVRFFVSEDFYDSFKYMPFLYIGAAFSSFAGYLAAAYIKVKSTKRILTTSLISGIINLLISFSLIKYIGLYASALGSFIGFSLMFILRTKDSTKILKVKINYKKIITLSALSVVFALLITYNNNILNILMITFSVGISFVLNKRVLKKVYLKLNLLK